MEERPGLASLGGTTAAWAQLFDAQGVIDKPVVTIDFLRKVELYAR